MCFPLRGQISRTSAKILCCGCLLLAVVFSWPAPVLYGKEIVISTDYNISGARCGQEIKFSDTRFMMYFNFVCISVVLASFVFLVCIYSAVWKVIKNHLALRNLRGSDGLRNHIIWNSSATLNSQNISTSNTSVSQQELLNSLQNDNKSSRKSSRTSFMFLVITAIFFLSYIPHFVLKIISLTVKDFLINLSYPGKLVYHTFVWCFFLNNIANPIVYLAFDNHFRKTLKSIYSKPFRRRIFNNKYSTNSGDTTVSSV